MFLLLASVLTAIVVSFLCSLAEAVLLSLDSVKLETDKAKGLPYARIMDGMKQNINRPISAILVLNTVAHTGGATVAGSAFDETFGDEWIWLFSTVFTVVILFGTEILPKVLGVSYSSEVATYLARPLKYIVIALRPFIAVTEWFTSMLIGEKEKRAAYSLEDLQTVAKIARAEKIISTDQEQIIVNTSKLKTRKIEEIMLPIEKVVFFHYDIAPEEYFDLAANYLHTRYPVSRSASPQDIMGYLNFKEIALHKDELADGDLHRFVRPLPLLREGTSIIQALKELNSKRYHLAIVQDAQGTNTGMVTLEDIVEEIVGEIADEFDTE